MAKPDPSRQRQVFYKSFADVKRDLDSIEQADRAGKVRSTGNWSVGQNLQHLAKAINASMDGVGDFKVPFFMRLMGRIFKSKITSGKPMTPGFKMPAGLPFAPDANVPTAAGVAEIRRAIARVDGGAKMSAYSPFLGQLTHDQWMGLHMGHCALHMSFIRWE